MVHLADVVLAAILGAAVLAIVLLARSHARHAKLINELRAEVTAQKILALTSAAALPAATAGGEGEITEPCTSRAKAKGHLALVAHEADAAPAVPRHRLRASWAARRRALTVGVTAATVLVGGTAAAIVTTGTTGRPADPSSVTVPAAPPAPGKKKQPPMDSRSTEADECEHDKPSTQVPEATPAPSMSSDSRPRLAATRAHQADGQVRHPRLRAATPARQTLRASGTLRAPALGLAS
ncbi:hypothetical protein [Streptomyces sp. NRRL S-350]|uniref:hypothetical protein n=1 Tax=Streptomyces sp. NRRL S-350 TaxID=1463902 RepID=UPI0004C17751|nr:hypothetical protein [Streptomyces sp. NRRL S-350]